MRKSLLGRIVSFIIGIVVLVAIAFAILFTVIKIKYDVNLLSVVGSVKDLNDPVDEDELCSYKCSDYTDEQLDHGSFNIGGGGNCIVRSRGDGTYYYVFPNTTLYNEDWKIPVNELGAMTAKLLQAYGGLDIKVGDEKLDVNLISFEMLKMNYGGNGFDFLIVLKVDLKPIRENLNSVLAKSFKKYVPDEMYISVEANITRADNYDIYDYTITPSSIKLNNLSEKKSEEIINALDMFTHIGDPEELSTNISSSIMKIIFGAREGEQEFKGIFAGIQVNKWEASIVTIGSTTGNETTHYIVINRVTDTAE